MLLLLIRWGYTVDGTGFNEHIGTIVKDNQYYQPARTLWDWMQLLIVPTALAVGGFFLSRSQSNHEQQIANENLQETALQTYLDQISALLLDKDLRNSGRDSEKRDIARARTLIALRRLDSVRKAVLIKFLSEADLIGRDEEKYIVNLQEADLRLIDLNGANLSFTSLNGVILNNANLEGTDLAGTDLTNAFLQSTNMSQANLSYSDLTQAVLSGANLGSADLSLTILKQANLEKANLRNAICIKADFYNANLRDVDLRGAKLQGAILDDADLFGAKYDKETRFPERFTPSQDMQFIR